MTRTAANGPSVGTSNASAQNPVDRQVGEADLLWLRETFDCLSSCTEGEFACSASERDGYEADRNRAAAIIADLEQVTRERDALIEFVRINGEAAGASGFTIFASDCIAFLASLRSMENG